MLLDADRSYGHEGLWGLGDIIIDTEVADPEFPGGDRIGPHRFPMAGLDRRLMDQLVVHRVENDRPLTRRERSEMALAFRRVLDPIGHADLAIGAPRIPRRVAPRLVIA